MILRQFVRTDCFLRLLIVTIAFVFSAEAAMAQPIDNRKYGQEDKFRQLEEILPTPNGYRNAAGEPGPEYWQQNADYVIDVTLDDVKQHITGSEKITYHNNSPHTLRYIWLQVDANIFAPDSEASLLRRAMIPPRMSLQAMKNIEARRIFDGSAKITAVKDAKGADLAHTVIKTMMRIELPAPLPPKQKFEFSVDWNYAINDAELMNGRTGYEFFEKDKNYIYEIAQWFPRLVAFTDATGWQHKQFLGQGEFTLELGDYLVRITAPDDHIVGATGVLQNPADVLTAEQIDRLARAKTSSKPLFIVTPEEALANEKEKTDKTKTWVFHAKNVRDFAFASSRKFIWDAQGHNVEGVDTMAMSFYPNEAEPLWSKYSTAAIIHTLNVYSRYTFGYPYPTAISVNGPIGGMEYPMICFNGPRPKADGTYSAGTKYGLISVVIHEVGHNYFPMIVNSDERQWTWMDEGINTFLQYLAEQEWEENYPSERGEPAAITPYMLSTAQVPIMTGSESILQFGENAYAKPATALNILRETVLGRELFDYAFKEYSRRWMFKRPMPADFFRTMEDASGVDLDWFWRGWFYSTDHCDIAIDKVTWSIPDDTDPDKEAARRREQEAATLPTMSKSRNQPLSKLVDRIPELKDFYNTYDRNEITPEQREAYQRFIEKLTDEERKMVEAKKNFYTVRLKNLGGLVMPIVLRVTYEDGSDQIIRLPAEAWQLNALETSTGFISEKLMKSIELDPYREIADANRDNNFFPEKFEPSRFQLYKSSEREGRRSRDVGENPMQVAKRREAEAAKKKEEAEAKAKAEADKKEADKKEAESKDAKAAETKPVEAAQPKEEKSVVATPADEKPAAKSAEGKKESAEASAKEKQEARKKAKQKKREREKTGAGS